MHRRNTGFLAILGIAALFFITTSAFAQVNLGTAQGFAVLGGSTVTNTGPTVITGNLGLSPGGSVTGFPPGIIIGALHANDAAAAQAQSDLTTAYNVAAGTPCTTNLSGQDLGSVGTLTPGVYCFTGSAGLTGTLTLNFQGNPNAFFLFKVGSALTTSSGSSVVLTNTGGTTCPTNLFWQVGSSATLGTGSTFSGSILALSSITITTGAGLTGHALARNGAVTLDTNTVNTSSCAPAAPVPALDHLALAMLVLLLAAAGVFAMRSR